MARLVLVHGSVANGAATWSAQRPLAERYELVVLEPARLPARPARRAGRLRGATRTGSRSSCARRPPLRPLLRRRRLAARGRVAPGAALADGDRAAGDLGCARAIRPRRLRRGRDRALARRAGEPEAFLRTFLRAVGSAFEPPSPLPPELEQGARTLMAERGPWEAEIPLASSAQRRSRSSSSRARTTRRSTRSATCSSASSTPSARSSRAPATPPSARPASTSTLAASSRARPD